MKVKMDKDQWLYDAKAYLNKIFDDQVELIAMSEDSERYIEENSIENLHDNGLHVGQMQIIVQLKNGIKFELWASEWGGIKLLD